MQVEKESKNVCLEKEDSLNRARWRVGVGEIGSAYQEHRGWCLLAVFINFGAKNVTLPYKPCDIVVFKIKHIFKWLDILMFFFV